MARFSLDRLLTPCVLLSTLFAPAALAQLPVLQPLITGLDRPTAIAVPHDGSGRVFVTLQTGAIAVHDGSLGSAALPTPVLAVSPACCGERGLLGMAFHPEFATNGYFYIDYTRISDGATVVERYQLDPPSSNVADPATAKTVLVIEQPAEQHNGGDLKFGPDGYLYIATGDGGFQVPQLRTAQDPASLLGKILRVDVDGGDPYAIPPENVSGNEVYAMGLRNPWRFSFDRQTGDLVLGDVGWGDREEINVIPHGVDEVLNFGWPFLEGDFCHSECDTPGLTPPVIKHGHLGENGAFSITGGFTYRGTKYRQFVGRYFYADYVTGKMWLGEPAGLIGPLTTGLEISTFGEDEAGELLLADYREGTIYRIESTSTIDPPLVSAVVNGATFAATAPIAPGSITTVFASNLGFESAFSLFPQTTFNGVQVTINGQPAPLFAVVPSGGQINLLAPNTLPTAGTASLVVTSAGQTSNTVQVNLAATAPGIFPIFNPSDLTQTYAAATLAGTAWIPVPDAVAGNLGVPVGCEANQIPAASVCGRPAKGGDVLQIYLTGLGEATANGLAGGPTLGPAEPAPADGSILYLTVETPVVTIARRELTVVFSGLAPGFAGLYQINVILPDDLPAGDFLVLTVSTSNGLSDSKLIALAR